MSEQILKKIEVRKKVKLSDSTIYRLINKGQFPPPIKLSERSSGWLSSEIDAWLEMRIKASRSDMAD